MKILKAQFIKSAASLSDSLPPDKAEVAFLGRSNVGKSSLINALVSQKSLAKSSQTPGKTRLINFFSVSVAVGDEVGEFRLVDLPGFGYAVSRCEIRIWLPSSPYSQVRFDCERQIRLAAQSGCS